MVKTEYLRNITDYKEFIHTVKSKIQSAQIKAHIQVNETMLRLYWEIARMIVEKQKHSSWGDGFIAAMSKDLKEEFPNMKGFSTTNIKYMKQWYLFWYDEVLSGQQAVAQIENEKSQQAVDRLFQIPWGHNLAIMSKSKNRDEARFYLYQTIQNNYSRAVLIHEIESGLYERQGKAITNFETKLPDIHSDLAMQTLKDPYNFDFLDIRSRHDEKELEDALMENMTKFLLELGQGFSFVGRQYKLNVGGSEFKIDLLFYHVKLYCYVVVELKVSDFKPEFAGKLNFYVSAVDGEIKNERDNPTIGILICKSKNDTVVEYALKDINKPIGVSEYQLTHILPENLRSSFPAIEEIEAELGIVNV
ncbi:MAG: PDDEXK nuclease domain-containing protein [Sulfuricurvum sp.]|jgi:predicted nuclease of restriction endonuclease-like (RecB) superfamily|uniref:PDDEXK nuclease domain-containing protein n=1 Tax=Sulfuricurvum sp. TaxID=2025608 RepID=UPI0025F53B2B|nr:PDDEXK nuclease domain-containing protein [Sulfuricurvum sp.]MCK9373152.1 PDDEXK nuclease domain-containing protein [Sulfuricurvum sp.]